MLVEFSSGFFWCLGALSAVLASIISALLVVKFGSLCMRFTDYIVRKAEEEECQKE